MWEWLTQDTMTVTRLQVVWWWCVADSALIALGFGYLKIRAAYRRRDRRERWAEVPNMMDLLNLSSDEMAALDRDQIIENDEDQRLRREERLMAESLGSRDRRETRELPIQNGEVALDAPPPPGATVTVEYAHTPSELRYARGPHPSRVGQLCECGHTYLDRDAPPGTLCSSCQRDCHTQLRIPCFECGTFFTHGDDDQHGTRCKACRSIPGVKEPRTWYERLLE